VDGNCVETGNDNSGDVFQVFDIVTDFFEADPRD
jgi:hypothetical protein